MFAFSLDGSIAGSDFVPYCCASFMNCLFAALICLYPILLYMYLHKYLNDRVSLLDHRKEPISFYLLVTKQ